MNEGEIRDFLVWLQAHRNNLEHLHFLGDGTRVSLRFPQHLEYSTRGFTFYQTEHPLSANISASFDRVKRVEYHTTQPGFPGYAQLVFNDDAHLYLNLKGES